MLFKAPQTIQSLCTKNCRSFEFGEQWPPFSPDANPLDFSIWGILTSIVGVRKYQSVDAMKSEKTLKT